MEKKPIVKRRATGGRPPVEIEFDRFVKLCEIQCTLMEIASFFDCSVDTVERWCERELGEGFADSFKRYAGNGRASLRRRQFKAALEGNTAMMIFLGKQYLDQSDKFSHEGTEHKPLTLNYRMTKDEDK